MCSALELLSCIMFFLRHSHLFPCARRPCRRAKYVATTTWRQRIITLSHFFSVLFIYYLCRPVSQRERDLPPDKVVTLKLLKDTTRFSAPFTSLSLHEASVQKSYIRRDNVMAAARKRFGDLNVANGPLRLDQQLFVTANVNVGIFFYIYIFLTFVFFFGISRDNP